MDLISMMPQSSKLLTRRTSQTQNPRHNTETHNGMFHRLLLHPRPLYPSVTLSNPVGVHQTCQCDPHYTIIQAAGHNLLDKVRNWLSDGSSFTLLIHNGSSIHCSDCISEDFPPTVGLRVQAIPLSLAAVRPFSAARHFVYFGDAIARCSILVTQGSSWPVIPAARHRARQQVHRSKAVGRGG
jgi:hypothetical protein